MTFLYIVSLEYLKRGEWYFTIMGAFHDLDTAKKTVEAHMELALEWDDNKSFLEPGEDSYVWNAYLDPSGSSEARIIEITKIPIGSLVRESF